MSLVGMAWATVVTAGRLGMCTSVQFWPKSLVTKSPKKPPAGVATAA